MGEYTAEFTADEQACIDTEFERLEDSTYLDHAGTTLYTKGQISDAAQVLQRNVFCNPHTCRITGDYVDQVRYKILEFFNTNADEYHVVFTSNATAALRLVAEHFEFQSNGSFHYCQENHTSVLGMRELVKAKSVYMLTKDEIVCNINATHIAPTPMSQPGSSNCLVAFSAQCNFSGYKMPLSVIEKIQTNGLQLPGKCIVKNPKIDDEKKYFVCLDAASYAASSPLDLQRYRPDYVCISFYKIFGYPTGVGALLVSKRGAEALKKRYFGGGTINFAYPHLQDHEFRSTFHERFEDGTLPFLSIVELLQGFRTLQRLVPGRSMERISQHVHNLARYCDQQLRQLQHANGAPLIQLYNHAGYEDRTQQGGIVTFNVRTASGDYVGFGEVACVASLHRILLRTGCFCNIGACQHFMQLDDSAMDSIYKRAGRICGDYFDLLDGRPTGAVRVSFGYMTRVQDVDRLVEMLRKSYLNVKSHERLNYIEQRSEQLPKELRERAQRLRPQLLQLAIYPVKSCAALKLNESALTDLGLQYDREWMIVDVNGMALTQKRCTDLCLIRPRIVNDQLQLHFHEDDNDSNDSSSFVSVPLSLKDQAANSLRCRSKVCRQPIEGYDCGDEAANWLSQHLNMDGVRLLRQSSQRRSANGGDQKEQQKLSLVNQAQFLLVNRASVRSLEFEEQLDETVDRFRANLVIDTGVPFEELKFEQLHIGNVHFQVDGPCQRCDMICINQRTGQRSPDTLTTIARLQSGKMRFGIYISRPNNETQKLHQIACGDPIVVIE